MATTTSREVVFDVAPEKLLEVMINPDFQEAQRKLDRAVIQAKFKEILRSDDRVVFEIHSQEHERGVTGIDTKKKVEAVTRMEWDLKQRRGTWSYHTPQSDRVSITGDQTIEPLGDKARLITQLHLEVNIPLMGKKLEKVLAEGMGKGQDRYDALLGEYCNKSSSS